ncbi:hypothetical protein HMPREF3195_00296 [Peptostreptococcus anaerobius]|uniref:Uncharacterized protein n=1 Tax=Peptostreptococcus anaerobius TaxID=1261 RepID=A0A135YY38_9FIRM|nr:hypothetical protein HMPREF3195_00296 [Peptostreptococcus anaerobius]
MGAASLSAFSEVDKGIDTITQKTGALVATVLDIRMRRALPATTGVIIAGILVSVVMYG